MRPSYKLRVPFRKDSHKMFSNHDFCSVFMPSNIFRCSFLRAWFTMYIHVGRHNWPSLMAAQSCRIVIVVDDDDDDANGNSVRHRSFLCVCVFVCMSELC